MPQEFGIKKPTPTQRTVLALLKEQGTSHLRSGTRILKRVSLSSAGDDLGEGLSMNVTTIDMLLAHKLIARATTNMPGSWFELTDVGTAFVEKHGIEDFEREAEEYDAHFQKNRRSLTMRY